MTTKQLYVVGIGGTLHEHSTSRMALERALDAAREAGALVELFDLNTLNLPIFDPTKGLTDYDETVQRFIAAVRRADGMIWSTAAYHGTLAGVTKNALDYLEFLAEDERPYLHQRAIGVIATAAGDIAAVNTVRALVDIVHALRGTVVPLLAPIHHASRVIDSSGNVVDPRMRTQLQQLGKLVVETAARFHHVEQLPVLQQAVAS